MTGCPAVLTLPGGTVVRCERRGHVRPDAVGPTHMGRVEGYPQIVVTWPTNPLTPV